MLHGKIALVTGASRGIGLATAIALARDGATVIGTSTTQQGADGLAAKLKEINTDSCGIVLDVTNTDQLIAVVDEVKTRFKKIDILVNNAAVLRTAASGMRLSEAEWDIVQDTNLKPVFLMMKYVLPLMVMSKWGRIINISSIAGFSYHPGCAHYCATKAGMIGMTRTIAGEFADRNITANCVAPGYIDTDMAKSYKEAYEYASATFIDSVPIGRTGTPEEVAHAVTFLASPLASYITGTTIHVNGGMYMG